MEVEVRWGNLPLRNILPLKRQPLWKCKFFDLPLKLEISKFLFPAPNLSGIVRNIKYITNKTLIYCLRWNLITVKLLQNSIS